MDRTGLVITAGEPQLSEGLVAEAHPAPLCAESVEGAATQMKLKLLIMLTMAGALAQASALTSPADQDAIPAATPPEAGVLTEPSGGMRDEAADSLPGPLLNSERIRMRYGSYGIEVLHDDGRLRVSDLYSLSRGARITRTMAVVSYAEVVPEPLRHQHQQVQAGGSIGETFKTAGWHVSKRNVYLGELEPSDNLAPVYALMDDIAPGPLAIHLYELWVDRPGERYRYATIAEIHHPDYLRLADLQQLFPELWPVADAQDRVAYLLALLRRELAAETNP